MALVKLEIEKRGPFLDGQPFGAAFSRYLEHQADIYGLEVINTFKKQGVKIETMETPGGHEWANWRIYLHEVAPKLFR